MKFSKICLIHYLECSGFCLGSECSNRIDCYECMAKLHNHNQFSSETLGFVSLRKLFNGNHKSLLDLVGHTPASLSLIKSKKEVFVDSRIAH